MNNERITITEKQKDKIGKVCCNCGTANDLQYHHVVPLILGGNDVVNNIVCLCGKCHNIVHSNAEKEGYLAARSMLIKKGLEKARRKGKHIGRPTTGVPKWFEKELLNFKKNNKHQTVKEFCLLNDIAISTYYKYTSILKKEDTWNYILNDYIA